jgi:hypothetical protein
MFGSNPGAQQKISLRMTGDCHKTVTNQIRHAASSNAIPGAPELAHPSFAPLE